MRSSRSAGSRSCGCARSTSGCRARCRWPCPSHMLWSLVQLRAVVPLPREVASHQIGAILVDTKISSGSVPFYTVPTDFPEADGTYSWTSTSMVLVQLECGSIQGVGFTYADRSAAVLTEKLINEIVLRSDPFCHAATLQKLLAAIRNLGETGIAMMAVSAIDNALWDLRARLVNLPLVSLLGQVRPSIPLYGAAGRLFTSYSDKQLAKQLAAWAEQGFSMVKMKIGSEPKRDPERVIAARQAIGADCDLFVDANGAVYRDTGHRTRALFRAAARLLVRRTRQLRQSCRARPGPASRAIGNGYRCG